MKTEQFKAVFDQVGPAMLEMFNQGGGMQPMMLWVKLGGVDGSTVDAAGQVAEQAAMTRLFGEGHAASLMPVMVRDLLESAMLPEELGGGRPNAIVVVGEMTLGGAEAEAVGSEEGLGIWVHSAVRTEWGCLPVSTADGKRSCVWRDMVVTEAGRSGRMTMNP